MSNEKKEPVLERAEENPFEVGQITEQIPAWELWEDGIEPVDADGPKERAA
jgi:hypothetical protein